MNSYSASGERRLDSTYSTEELREDLRIAYRSSLADERFRLRIGALGASEDELLNFAASKYDGSTKSQGREREAIRRILKRSPKEGEVDKRIEFLAPILTTTGSIVGIESLYENLRSGRIGTLIYGMEADYVRTDGSITDRPLIWVPLCLTALSLTNRNLAGELYLTYFPSSAVVAKGDTKTRVFREAFEIEDVDSIEKTFLDNLKELCELVDEHVSVINLAEIFDQNTKLKEMFDRYFGSEIGKAIFWEEIPAAVRNLANHALVAEFGSTNPLEHGSPGDMISKEGYLSSVARSFYSECTKKGNWTQTSLKELLAMTTETLDPKTAINNRLGRNLVYYTGTEALVYTSLPATHGISLAAIGDKVGDEARKRAGRPETRKVWGRENSHSPISYWDEHNPGKGSYIHEPEHTKMFFDWQRPDNATDVRIGDNPDCIRKKFLQCPEKVRRDDLLYFFVPYWISTGQSETILDTRNYFEAHRKALESPPDKMDACMVDTLIEVSKKFEGVMGGHENV